MYKTAIKWIPTPTANLAINRSRIKLYGKNSEVPTYYLQKGQEFQIELFNPTKDTIMAKISLNGKPIAQGGLVLKPAQRVFLDRYIDVSRKFKFDTYEVSNTSESRKAIEDNGDFKVEFYKERTPNNYNPIYLDNRSFGGNNIPYFSSTVNTYNTTTLGLTDMNTTLTANINGVVGSSTSHNVATLDFMDQNLSRKFAPELEEPKKSILRSLKSKKSIETGRVEAGSRSDQTLETVYMNWEYTPFHSIEYKMLPLSQKINEVKDVKMKQYCVYCGMKNKTTFKFCPKCGERI